MNRRGLTWQASLVVIGDAITFASSLAASMALARILSSESMGTWRQVLYLTTMVAGLAELGVSATIYRFLNAFDSERRALYAKMLVVTAFTLGLLGSATLVGLAPILSNAYNNPNLLAALLLAAPIPLARLPVALVRPWLISLGYAIQATLFETVVAATAAGAIILLSIMGYSLPVALGAWALVNLMYLVAVPLTLSGELFSAGPWWDAAVFREVWGYLWPIQVGRIPGYVTIYLDKIVMSVVLGPRQFAIYSLGAREIPFVGAIGTSISCVLTPRLVEDVRNQDIEQIARRWRTACLKTSLFTYPIAMFCLFHPVPVMQFFFSSAYAESSVPFRVFSVLTFLRVVEYASLAKAFGRSDLIMKASFATALTLFAVAFPLTHLFGMAGMAWSLVMGNAAAIVYFLWHYRGLLQRKVQFFYPWPKLALIFGIACLSTAASSTVFAERLRLEGDTELLSLSWKLAVLLFASLGIYVPLAWRCGLLTTADIA